MSVKRLFVSLLLCPSLVGAAITNNVTTSANIPGLFVDGVCVDCPRFDGVGAISGGGATSRLLVDYPPDVQAEILDFLFLPNFGASLHILKVEIGGDSYSTDGSESSHMHSQDDLNLSRGYEWWLLKEAKKRNPHILTYGLPWAFPGWVTDDVKNPFQHIDRLTNYTLQWVKGAKEVHGIDIDYLGIWNERGTNREYVLAMRKVLDASGFNNVRLVVNDGQPKDLCPLMVNDTEYINTADILGFHYPNDKSGVWPICSSFDTPIWASEESSSYDDLNGAACWARVMASHYVLNNMTGNIMWNLVGSYAHGTGWYASSMLTAVQPWSGYYEWEQMPVVWATAHYTQFAFPGWRYMPVGKGSGELAQGGYYMTLVSPDQKYFTVIVVKISREHAPCTRPRLWNWSTQDEVFQITVDLPILSEADEDSADGETQTWYSNLEQEDTVLFQKLDNPGVLSRVSSFVKSSKLGVRSYDISLNVTAGSVFTVTNLMQAGNKGTAKVRNKPDARFPLPYYDDFNSYQCDNCYSKYLSDQMGAFEIHFIDDGNTDKNGELWQRRALVQSAPQVPVGWQGTTKNGPMTVVGMTEWEDVGLQVSFRLPDPGTFVCISTRTDQFWSNGVSMCANTSSWFLVYGGAPMAGFDTKAAIAHGTLPASLRQDYWHILGLSTQGHQVEASVNGDVVVGKDDVSIRVGDSGFVALGASAYAAVQFGHIHIEPVGPNWAVSNPSPTTQAGATWSMQLGLCTANGLTTDAERFEVTSNWQIKHLASGLCVTVVNETMHDFNSNQGVQLTLQKCVHDNRAQRFWHDYTWLRNDRLMSLQNDSGDLCATRDGKVSLTVKTPNVTCAGTEDAFLSWALYPNTQQLRNTFGYDPSAGGRAQCLGAVQAKESDEDEFLVETI
ncbi:galactosylceramidase [Seminavis robusta]|uniref:galactosylceramidase n=1 Tax=Seminavis robusta TaxID=568900 RepID=A0A9N8HKN8_9STRA|nr:galactosylceramidase [Seminavis robusta]|eukprot:Sro959_g224830.1 galactosylceramidase (897) ;mRNA; f:37178-39868